MYIYIIIRSIRFRIHQVVQTIPPVQESQPDFVALLLRPCCEQGFNGKDLGTNFAHRDLVVLPPTADEVPVGIAPLPV